MISLLWINKLLNLIISKFLFIIKYACKLVFNYLQQGNIHFYIAQPTQLKTRKTEVRPAKHQSREE